MNNPRLEYLREKVRRLPKEPGVYLMRDKSGKIIYIGKAKALQQPGIQLFPQCGKTSGKSL